MRFLQLSDLRERGIKFSRAHIHRMISERTFPAPVKIGPKTNAWIESEVDAWAADRISQRSLPTPSPFKSRKVSVASGARS